MKNHRLYLSNHSRTQGRLRYYFCDVLKKYILAACLLFTLQAGCQSEVLAKASEKSSEPDMVKGIPARAEIISHRGPDIPESEKFRVWVNGNEMFTGQTGDRRWNYSFCAFDFSKPVTVRG